MYFYDRPPFVLLHVCYPTLIKIVVLVVRKRPVQNHPSSSVPREHTGLNCDAVEELEQELNNPGCRVANVKTTSAGKRRGKKENKKKRRASRRGAMQQQKKKNSGSKAAPMVVVSSGGGGGLLAQSKSENNLFEKSNKLSVDVSSNRLFSGYEGVVTSMRDLQFESAVGENCPTKAMNDFSRTQVLNTISVSREMMLVHESENERDDKMKIGGGGCLENDIEESCE